MTHRIEAEAVEQSEEARRVADARHGMKRPGAPLSRIRDCIGLPQIPPRQWLVAHRRLPPGVDHGQRLVLGREAHQRVDAIETRRRLAQRAGGKHATVAEAARAVDNRNLELASQGVVLQPVVGEDDVALRMRREQRARGCDAVAPDLSAICPATPNRIALARLR